MRGRWELRGIYPLRMGAESRRETWVLDLAVVVVGYAAAIVDMACHISQRVPV